MKTWTTKNGYTITRVMGGRSNVFLLAGSKKNILVDTGTAGSRRRLHHRLGSLGVRRIDLLILTHTHFDHAGNAAWIRKSLGAMVLVHQAEAGHLSTGGKTMPAGTNFFTRPMMTVAKRHLGYRFLVEPCDADITVDARFELGDFGYNAYVLPTPGHTVGSVSLIIDDTIALAGDTLFGIFPGSAFPPFADDVPELLASWEILLNTGCTLFFPSHGSPVTRSLLLNNFKARSNML